MQSPGAPQYGSHDDLEALNLRAVDVVTAIEQAFHGQDAGRVWCVPKSALQLPDGRYVMSTLAVGDRPGYVAVKSLALNPRNPEFVFRGMAIGDLAVAALAHERALGRARGV